MSFDSSILNFLYNLAGRYSLLGWLFGFLSDTLPYILAAIFILFIITNFNWRKRIYLFSLAVISIVLSRGLITEIIWFFYERARPFVELNLPTTDYSAMNSMPSGHMALLTPIVLLVWHENKKLGKWFIGGLILVGAGRVATAMHWPTDILVGIAIGAASFYLVRKFLPKA